jgi:hypothetical protein
MNPHGVEWSTDRMCGVQGCGMKRHCSQISRLYNRKSFGYGRKIEHAKPIVLQLITTSNEYGGERYGVVVVGIHL